MGYENEMISKFINLWRVRGDRKKQEKRIIEIQRWQYDYQKSKIKMISFSKTEFIMWIISVYILLQIKPFLIFTQTLFLPSNIKENNFEVNTNRIGEVLNRKTSIYWALLPFFSLANWWYGRAFILRFWNAEVKSQMNITNIHKRVIFISSLKEWQLKMSRARTFRKMIW